MTAEQKDILEIKEDLKSIRGHLDKIKKRQDDDDLYRASQNAKLDLIVNSLVDNDFNGKNGMITRLNTMEKMVISHDFYWRVLFGIIACGALIIIAMKLIIKYVL